jgi:hypothetical protein
MINSSFIDWIRSLPCEFSFPLDAMTHRLPHFFRRGRRLISCRLQGCGLEKQAEKTLAGMRMVRLGNLCACERIAARKPGRAMKNARTAGAARAKKRDARCRRRPAPESE